MNSIEIGVIGVISTLIIYVLSMKLYKRIKSPFLLPVFISTILLVIILLICHVPYSSYMLGAN